MYKRQAFYLLKSVLADEGLSAVCKIVLKDREQLASLNPFANTMLLSTLYWPDEVRSLEELDLPKEEPEFKAAERQMAKQLISAMRGEFKADEYRDEYREALMGVIEAKVAGQPAQAPRVVAAKPTKITDLMSVLEASVAAVRESREGKSAAGEAAVEPESLADRRKRKTSKPAAARTTRRSAAKEPAETAPGKRAAAGGRPERRRKTA